MPLEKQATVKFDASKKAHREAAAAFLQRRSWNDSPIRFSHDPSYGSVADQVEKKMLAFYMGREKLKIPVSPNPATMVGTIVDGVVLESPGTLDQPKPGYVRVLVSANDEDRAGFTLVNNRNIDIMV